MNKFFLFTLVCCGFVWAVDRYVKFRRDRRLTKFKSQSEIRKIIATGKPFIAPPELLPKMNRKQRRRFEKLNKHGKKP